MESTLTTKSNETKLRKNAGDININPKQKEKILFGFYHKSNVWNKKNNMTNI